MYVELLFQALHCVVLRLVSQDFSAKVNASFAMLNSCYVIHVQTDVIAMQFQHYVEFYALFKKKINNKIQL